MGRLLDEYLAQNVPALQNIVSGGGGGGPPGGAQTFPMPVQPEMQGQPLGPGGQPSGPMERASPAFPPPPGAGQIDPGAVAPAPTFGEPGGPAGPPEAAIAPVTPQQQPDRSLEFDATNPDSFAGMAAGTDPEAINKAVNALDEQLKTQGTTIDEKHAEVTGGEPEESEDDPSGEKAAANKKEQEEAESEEQKQAVKQKQKLTRQEKGLILMEFGLNLMAASGTGEGTWASDIGQAGSAAISGHMGRKRQAREDELARAEADRKKRLDEARIAQAERADTTVKADSDGNYVIIDEQTGESKPVTMDGKPVSAGNQDKFASEVDRQAYEDLECAGLEGDELKACKRRALAYGKGGGAKVAFPELERGDQVDRVMKNLEDPDKKSAKYRIPSTGQTKRWRDMNPDEQLEVAEGFVERRMQIINKGDVATEEGEAKTTQGETFGLSQEQIGTMQEGKKYQITGGKWVAIVDGKLVEVD